MGRGTDIDEVHVAFTTELFDLRENLLDQQLALLLHVPAQYRVNKTEILYRITLFRFEKTQEVARVKEWKGT